MPNLNITSQEFALMDNSYCYELHLDTKESKLYNFTSDKYSGYIYVDYGCYYLHCINIDGKDKDLNILRQAIHEFGIPHEDIRKP